MLVGTHLTLTYVNIKLPNSLNLTWLRRSTLTNTIKRMRERAIERKKKACTAYFMDSNKQGRPPPFILQILPNE